MCPGRPRAQTRLTIGILNTSTAYLSNTIFRYDCPDNSDPAVLFKCIDNADHGANDDPTRLNNGADFGDRGVQMAWDIGMLGDGASATTDCVLGTNQGSFSLLDLPLPAPLPMFSGALAALGLVGFRLRRRSAANAV